MAFDFVLDVVRKTYYRHAVIRSLQCSDTERLFARERVRRFVNIQETALRRLTALDGARESADLRIPPSNRLEALRGDRAGQYSIGINAQYRICFRWQDNDAYDVQIADYH